MRSNIIHDLPDWQVTSFGNGLAYEIRRKSDQACMLFQDEDASAFRDEFQRLTEHPPFLDYADALTVIFHDYEEFSTC